METIYLTLSVDGVIVEERRLLDGPDWSHILNFDPKNVAGKIITSATHVELRITRRKAD